MPIRTLTVTPAPGKWVVRAGGAVLGESSRALVLEEEGRDPVVYFPREDLGMAFLEPTETVTALPERGDARHFTIVAKSGPIPDAAWSYERTEPELAALAGLIAFSPRKAIVERV